MNIGIDARFYGTLGKGLGRYTSELIRHLETVDSKNTYVIFLRRENFDEYAPKNPRFTKALAEFPWYTWREQLLYPLWLRRYKLDLMHFPHFNVPMLYRRPFVVTVHDLILREHPTTRATTLGPVAYRLKYLAYRAVIRRALAAARTIITVSRFTKNEIEHKYPFCRNKKVAVTYEACADRFRNSGVRTPAGAPYALYVGNAYPHKNLERLIEAFAAFRKKNPDYALVLVGAKDYFYERLEAEARKKNMAEGVTFFGQASDDELDKLYAGAAFYVFPSMHEGFGLPPLEAMCKDVPVASSSAGSMPEILKDAACYFDPRDTNAIASALEKIAGDAMLRRSLVAKGKERAAAFSWRRCAEETLAVYQESAV